MKDYKGKASFNKISKAFQTKEEKIVIKNDGTKLTAFISDWIVEELDTKNKFPISDEFFKERYQPIENENGLYVKKPVIVQAIKVDIETEVFTREGISKAFPGDYIIYTVNGVHDVYPVSKNTFEERYEI